MLIEINDHKIIKKNKIPLCRNQVSSMECSACNDNLSISSFHVNYEIAYVQIVQNYPIVYVMYERFSSKGNSLPSILKLI